MGRSETFGGGGVAASVGGRARRAETTQPARSRTPVRARAWAIRCTIWAGSRPARLAATSARTPIPQSRRSAGEGAAAGVRCCGSRNASLPPPAAADWLGGWGGDSIIPSLHEIPCDLSSGGTSRPRGRGDAPDGPALVADWPIGWAIGWPWPIGTTTRGVPVGGGGAGGWSPSRAQPAGERAMGLSASSSRRWLISASRASIEGGGRVMPSASSPRAASKALPLP